MNIKCIILHCIKSIALAIGSIASITMIVSAIAFFCSLVDKMDGVVSNCQSTYYVCLKSDNLVCRIPYNDDITNNTCIAFDTSCSLMNIRNKCIAYSSNYYDIFPWMSNAQVFWLSLCIGLITAPIGFIDDVLLRQQTDDNYVKLSQTDDNL